MEQEKRNNRLGRGLTAVFIGLVMLAAGLPCTGAILPGPPLEGMWRCGPYLFYPDTFFMLVGSVTTATGTTLWGIARGNAFEILGWILFGLLFLFAMLG